MRNGNFNLNYLGQLATRTSKEIKSSKIGVGFETLDRDMWDVNQAWPLLNPLGVKWARVQSGWSRTERKRGVYDFTWLDQIVDQLIECGVAPWLSVSYGNPVYTPGASVDGAGYPPVYTAEEGDGWKNYVKALAKHFRDRVDHFEIWNEPDASGFFRPEPDPVLYAKLIKMTSSAIRQVQPEAFLIGGALGSAMHPGGLEYLIKLFENQVAGYIDAISYHGYKYMPEQYLDQELPSFLYILKKYAPHLQYWQGETGCPSKVQKNNTEALSGMKVSEEIQARWMLRRILLEAGAGASLVSYFSMGDFSKYVRDKDLGFASYYGLLRLEDGSPKPSYTALQTLATLLCDPLETSSGRTSFRMQGGQGANGLDREEAATAWQVNLLKDNIPLQAWWLRKETTSAKEWKTIDLYYWLDEDIRLKQPVIIDPLSQEVYAVKKAFRWGMNELANLPISNTPLILTDLSTLNIKA